MHAIILAAGRGSRLARLNPDHRPKCLLDVGGRSLLDRQLHLLDACGVQSTTLVVGYEADRISDEIAKLALKTEVALRYNPRFELGSALSLWTAQEILTAGEDVFLLDADVLCHPAVVQALVATEAENCLLLDRDFEPGDEPVKIAVRDGEIVEFRKKIPDGLAYDLLGESVGLFRFGPETARRIAQRCAAFESAGLADSPHEDVLRAEFLDRPGEFTYEDVTGFPWIEIDFDEDLDKARMQVLPAIRRDYPEF